MIKTIKAQLLRFAPAPLTFLYSAATCEDDRAASLEFLRTGRISLTRRQRWRLLCQYYQISYRVCCRHTQEEMWNYATEILSCPRNVHGCFVEAGTYKGGSTAKFSLAARLADRKLVVFDSFEGIPDNDEAHDKNIFGGRARFKPGSYCGGLEEVQRNVSRFGQIAACRFIKGWFDQTMPLFDEPVAGIYLDVDLVASTKTCLKYLYPLLSVGGVLFSQDGHLPLVVQLFDDDQFWESEIGCPKPVIEGLRTRKLLRIVKTHPCQGPGDTSASELARSANTSHNTRVESIPSPR